MFSVILSSVLATGGENVLRKKAMHLFEWLTIQVELHSKRTKREIERMKTLSLSLSFSLSLSLSLSLSRWIEPPFADSRNSMK